MKKSPRPYVYGQTKNTYLIQKNEFDEKKADSLLKNGLGMIARLNEKRGPEAQALLSNKIQKYFLEKTRLGIPVIFHEESLHGNQARAATNFPSPLGLASSWNEALLKEIYTSIAEEVRARGAHLVLAPVVDLAMDPRWGRTEETLGEDTYLVTRLAVAEVKAYQGIGEKIDKKHVATTLKHFAVHGKPEGGVNVSPSFVDERQLKEVFFPPFKACIQEAGATSVMPNYNELSGIPSHANKYLLREVLRQQWGFKGIVVSDYGAVNDLAALHKVVPTSDEAGALALESGIEIETPDVKGFANLGNLLKSGKIKQATLDSAVSHILRIKFLLGLFDDPYINPSEAEKIVGSAANRQIALKAARETMVLLKNDKKILPLNKKEIKTLALIGPNANRCILGGYSDTPRVQVTPLEAIKTRAGKGIEVLYNEGCRITDKGNWFDDPVALSKPEENRKRIAEAVEVAKKADMIVLFLGGNEATSREAWAKDHPGDLTTLELLGEQNELIKQVTGLNKPVAAFVFSGPPLAFRYLNDHVSSIVQCWYMGQETGTAVAEALFGETNPSGKLPVSIPRSVGHIPSY